jgi:hypothetical protein
MLTYLYYLISVAGGVFLLLFILGFTARLFKKEKKIITVEISAKTFLEINSSEKNYNSILTSLDAIPDFPESFGYKINWLAIKTDDSKKVVNLLQLTSVHDANWKSGLAAAYQGFTFVSPTINDWVFVVSMVIPELPESLGKGHYQEFMQKIANEFEEVQFFGSYRRVDYYAWGKYINGIESRSFCSSENGIYQVGEITKEELSLDKDIAFELYPDDLPEEGSEEFKELMVDQDLDENDVLQMAELWSLNPAEFNDMEESEKIKGVGYVGDLVVTFSLKTTQ